MKNLGKDFKEKINTEWFYFTAISHIEGWGKRYKEYKTKKEVEFDLNVNHDPSLEIENAEYELGRKLTIDENDYLVKTFNKTVIKNINLKKLRNL